MSRMHWIVQGKQFHIEKGNQVVYDKKWDDYAVGKTRKQAIEKYEGFYGGRYEVDEEDKIARCIKVYEK